MPGRQSPSTRALVIARPVVAVAQEVGHRQAGCQFSRRRALARPAAYSRRRAIVRPAAALLEEGVSDSVVDEGTGHEEGKDEDSKDKERDEGDEDMSGTKLSKGRTRARTTRSRPPRRGTKRQGGGQRTEKDTKRGNETSMRRAEKATKTRGAIQKQCTIKIVFNLKVLISSSVPTILEGIGYCIVFLTLPFCPPH